MDPVPAARLRVLVVDDDPDTADSTAALVRLFGFDCRSATSGIDALRLPVISRRTWCCST